MAGLFINTLPMRVHLDAVEPAIGLAGRIQTQQLDLGRYEWSSLLKVQEWSEMARGEPLFENIVVFENYPVDESAVPAALESELGLEMSHSFDKTNFPLELVAAAGARIYLRVSYDDVRFERVEILRLLGHLVRLLAGVAADPTAPAGELELLCDTERHQLRCERLGLQAPQTADDLMHRLFERQVERTPAATAVAGPGGMSYDQLNRRANRLARLLRSHGAGAGRPIALLAHRGADFLTAMLAAFKAGSPYLPLAPGQPVPRQVQILQRSGAPLALASREHEATLAAAVAELPAGGGPLVLPLEELLAREADERNLADGCAPQETAYVIFTSGSTGAPKGAMVEHRGMLNHLLAKVVDLELSGRDVVAQTAAQSFDISVWQFLAVLLVGGAVRVFPEETANDPALFLDRLGADGVTVFETVPALLRLIVQEAQHRGASRPTLAGLRWALATGDVLPPSACRDWLALYPRVPVVNAYGPTECSDDVTHHTVRCATDLVQRRVPIGRAVRNLELYVADPMLRLLPARVPGELCVGGIAVGRGYLNDPALTAAVFVPDPWSGRHGARLYKAGDLVRMHEDGVLELRWRLDQQIKIRGFRVELEEIEAVLRQHPEVADAAVVAKGEGADRRLLAFLVPAAADATAGELDAELAGRLVPGVRAFVAERLPDYMVPAGFALLPALPLTPHGKLNRIGLTKAEWELPAGGYDAPATPLQDILAAIWSEVLNLPRVGLDDNFFIVGGNSLSAIQVVSRIRRTLKVEVALRSLFDAPTLGALSLVVEQAMQAGRGAVLPPIRPVARNQDLPLSFAQQRLWFVHQMAPESPVYNIPVALRIERPVDAAALRRSFEGVVKRHEVLRTSFEAVDGEPFQRIVPGGALHLPVIDLAALAPPVREAAARAVVRLLARDPFDVRRAPLLRLALLKLAAADHVVSITAHHLVTDAWSMRILIHEMATLYGQVSRSLPDLPIQYADFASWQRQWLQGETLQAELAWWRERLGGAPPLLELPADRPRPPVQSYRGKREAAALPLAVSEALRAASRREGATLFMLLLAGYQALLFRHTDQSDICVGTPVAGRFQQETENLIGVFINTLVLRGRPAAALEFRQLVAQTRDTVLEVFAHPHMPFEKLVEELHPERSLQHNPLFQTMFILQNLARVHVEGLAADAADESPGMSYLPVDNSSSRFDLLLQLYDGGAGELFGMLEFSADLFDSVTIQRLWSHLRTLLAGAAADGSCSLAELPWLDPGERWQVVGEWNDTASELAAVCVHELIERQAASCPDSTALVAADRALTYGELQRRAHQLAHYLRGLGAGPGVVVGLLLEREPEMLLGLLGVLAAGAAYLPLDPEYPRERSTWIVADAAPRLVLTSERLASRLPLPGPGVVRLDADWPKIARCSGAGLRQKVGALDVAYLIYTSGSTGRPKGVEVSHGALSNLLLAMRARPGLGAADRLLAVTSLSFDIAGLELFLPLVCGAQVVLAGRDDVVDGRRLAGLLASCGATAMQGTPATWRLLLDNGWPGHPGLVALCGGEGLPAELAAEIRGRTAALWNLYGPTETTVWSAIHAVVPEGRGLIPLGRPIANTEIHLLAAGTAQPVPIGGVGELCIGGAGVARGYRNQPVLTAERFVPDPFAARRGARLYRTGDLARALPSGVLEFLGRTDHQVKVRGFRIELGEIESVLGCHLAVQQAAVVVRREAAGHPLVAYVVPRPGAAAAAAADLRGFLAERLPEFMIPGAFVFLDSLPLTPNGKLDRRDLASRELAPERGGPTLAAPRTAVEEVLAAIWSDVLARHPIGRDDDFFALGGHSLLAARVASRIRGAFGLEVPLRSLFERRSLAELAQDIELRRRGAGAVPLAAIEPAERGGEMPLSSAQERLWFAHQLDPSSAAYNVHLAVALTGVLAREALDRALAELVQRHEALRTVFPSRAGRAQQVVLPPQPPAMPVLDLAALGERAEREARRLGEEESRVPFDLGRGPLLRVHLLRLGAASHVLLLTLHHVITDAWSMNVLTVELAALYDAFAAGAAPALPRLPIQYADYASWEGRWFTEETLDRELSWWRSRLHGAPERSALPFDGPPTEPPSRRGAGHRFLLPLELSRALQELSRREAVTLFMTLLAVFKVLLYRTTGQEDVIVGTNVANRNRLETEGLIGFFVNLLALRTDLGGNPTFQQLLARVRETTLEAVSHQDLPFEKLVSGLRLSGSARQRPVFQVLCTLDDDAGPAAPVAVHGLDFVLLPAPMEPAKFDLALFFTRRDAAITGRWSYPEGLFAPATIERLSEDFVALATHAAEHPEARLDSLDRLPALQRAEREKQRTEQQERRLASLKRGKNRSAILVADAGAGE